MRVRNGISGQRWFHALGLFAVVAVGAYFRLAHLGMAAFRADSFEIWKVCQQPLSMAVIWTRFLEILGQTGQFPFTLVVTKGFLDLFHLPPTEVWIRLPGSLFGIAAIPCAYLAGKTASGRRFGLLFALLFALSPFQIQTAREAYFYSPMLPGAVMLLWSVIWAFRHRKLRTRFPIRFYVITGLGFLFTSYSHMTGWWMAFPAAMVILGVLLARACRRRSRWVEVAVIAVVFGAIGMPLVFEEWALPYFLNGLRDIEGNQAKVAQVFGINTQSLGSLVANIGMGLSWGHSTPRAILLVAVVICAAVLVVQRRRNNRPLALAMVLASVGFALYYTGYRVARLPFAVRYCGFLFPVFTFILATAIWRISTLPGLRRLGPRLRRIPSYALAALASVLLVPPAVLCTQLTGLPIPYKDIQARVNSNLPPGTLVLVDRWFEPWNQLKMYNSTNVFFTFTVPNEPIDVARQVNWWQTAKDFFAKYPDAAYLEVCNSYWEQDQKWPYLAGQFVHHVTIDDPASRELDRIGLAYRGYQSVDFFYNTPRDVVNKARAIGRKTMVLFGPGWGYTKLWQQMRGDFRDWRVLERQAVLNIYNFAGSATNATIIIRGVGVNGSKSVRASNGATFTFSQGQLVEWKIERLPLQPGLNALVFNDPAYSQRGAVLLISDVLVEEVKTGEKK